MTRLLASILALSLVWTLPAQAKPKSCFTAAELGAERLVRQGLRLREGAKGCDGDPWNFHTQAQWDDINNRFGKQFAAQTKIRKGAFIREFDKEAEYKLSESDGRIVMHYRGYPLSPTYCADIKKLLTDMQKSGWVTFTKRANAAPDEVNFVYRKCG